MLCHDLTQIIPGEYKDARFRKGHIVTEADIPVLLAMGKEHLFVWEKKPGMLHENEAAERLADLCGSEHMRRSAVKEGKIELTAEIDGLFQVDTARLQAVNAAGEVMIAARHGNTPVRAGDKLLGTRVIPLVIAEETLRRAERAAGEEPLFRLLPFTLRRAAIVVTGSEVEKGLIEEAGRLDVPGRPVLFRTTDVFLRTFGIQSLRELPSLPELAEGEQLTLALQEAAPPETEG